MGVNPLREVTGGGQCTCLVLGAWMDASMWASWSQAASALPSLADDVSAPVGEGVYVHAAAARRFQVLPSVATALALALLHHFHGPPDHPAVCTCVAT